MAMSDNHAVQTVAAARIASDLDKARQIARQLAISSKNARAIVLRVGNRAAGLAVIANYYDELANKTISLARSINKTALDISSHSVTRWRNSSVLAQLIIAGDLDVDAQHHSDIDALAHNIRFNKNLRTWMQGLLCRSDLPGTPYLFFAPLSC
ncbi:MAG: hypothetical protein CSB48_07390 [Proteobacteria bacterium]|nr:MAG: hypothetical protein CSB48_07390 [Pseudomonadota bacterium]PIE40193.1 MAG: hypothetical protein CSA51_02205 [Gammaproteobacteria bacterium]